MSTDFSAKSSALGYLYQVRYALHVLLDRGEEAEISIETLDDITFDPVGAPTELLQLKHHINTTANLSDTSPDIWKSLRVWSEQLVKGSVVLPGFTLTLVTTASAPGKSACSMLLSRNRNPVKALEQLETAAKNSTNQELQKAFGAFMSLTPTQRGQLVDAITILDVTPDVIDIVSLIRKRIMYATPPEFLDALYERLEGWWLSTTAVLCPNRGRYCGPLPSGEARHVGPWERSTAVVLEIVSLGVLVPSSPAKPPVGGGRALPKLALKGWSARQSPGSARRLA